MCFKSRTTLIVPPTLAPEALHTLIQEKKEAGNIEFAFDLNEVLFFKDIPARIRLMWHFPHKLLFLKVFFNLPLLIKIGALGYHWLRDMSPFPDKHGEVTTEQLVIAFREAGYEELATFVIQVSDTLKVDKTLIPVLQMLKDHGYILRIATNLGKSLYTYLKATVAGQGHRELSFFTQDEQGMEGKVMDYSVSLYAKPAPQYYQEYNARYNAQGGKLIIFIDDKKANVKAAAKQGMIGIIFYSPQQLLQDLQELGLV